VPAFAETTHTLMNWTSRLLVGSLACIALAGTPELRAAQGLGGVPLGRIEARIWLDRGVDPVLQAGERVRVYYRASEDAYIAVFHVDTDGLVRLVLPAGPADERDRVRGGADYRLLSETAEWEVRGDPGVGYFFVLASVTPFDFDWLSSASSTGEWELVRTGARIEHDPFVAMDGLTRLFLPMAELADLALDFTAYHVGQSFSYPRFLCYECHQAEPFAAWNPYQQACPMVRVVIFNDPYFYPATRYQGSRVAYPRPPIPGVPQFAFRERFVGEPGTPDVRARVGPTAPNNLLPSPPGRALDPRVNMMVLLEEAGAVASGFSGPPGTPGPRLGAAPGVPDPRTPSVIGPQDDRPSFQRRVNQQGDPQPR
jgi:hypothetical protein